MKFIIIKLFLILVLVNLITAQPKSHVKAGLVSGSESVKPGDEFVVAVKLKMDPGWHTYWHNPGEAGMATSVKWDLPEGLEAGDLQFPYPDIFETGGVISYGYSDEVYLFTLIHTSKEFDKEKMVIQASVSWLECKEECIPGSEKVSLQVPVTNVTKSKGTSAFNLFRKKIPVSDFSGNVSASKDSNGIKIYISGIDPGLVTFFPYEGGIYNINVEQNIKTSGDKAVVYVPFDNFKVKDPDKVKGILVSSNGWNEDKNKALEINIKLNQ